MPRIDPPMIRPRFKGDLVIGGPSGSPIILPIGAEGAHLTVSGGSPAWVTPPPIYTSAQVDTILSFYSETGHTHAIGEVTGLELALGERSLVGHLHNATEITGIEGYVDNIVIEAVAEGIDVVPIVQAEVSTQIAAIEPSTIGAAPAVHTHLWGDVTDPPATYAPSPHNHPWAEITDPPATYDPSAHTHLWAEITDPPATYTPSAHSHPWGEVTGKPATYPATAHDHNDLYYTESEMNTLLATKSDTTHNHDAAYAGITHTHDDRYYTEAEVTALIAEHKPKTARAMSMHHQVVSSAGNHIFPGSGVTFSGLVPGATYQVVAHAQIQMEAGSGELVPIIRCIGADTTLYDQSVAHVVGANTVMPATVTALAFASATGTLAVSWGVGWVSGSSTVSRLQSVTTITKQ